MKLCLIAVFVCFISGAFSRQQQPQNNGRSLLPKFPFFRPPFTLFWEVSDPDHPYGISTAHVPLGGFCIRDNDCLPPFFGRALCLNSICQVADSSEKTQGRPSNDRHPHGSRPQQKPDGTQLCNVDSECIEGDYCVDHACVPKVSQLCRLNSDCIDGTYCLNNVCVKKSRVQTGGFCTEHSDCAPITGGFAFCSGFACRVHPQSHGHRKPRESRETAASIKEIISNALNHYPHKTEPTEFQFCKYNSDCIDADYCIKNACVRKGEISDGEYCRESSDCEGPFSFCYHSECRSSYLPPRRRSGRLPRESRKPGVISQTIIVQSRYPKKQEEQNETQLCNLSSDCIDGGYCIDHACVQKGDVRNGKFCKKDSDCARVSGGFAYCKSYACQVSYPRKRTTQQKPREDRRESKNEGNTQLCKVDSDCIDGDYCVENACVEKNNSKNAIGNGIFGNRINRGGQSPYKKKRRFQNGVEITYNEYSFCKEDWDCKGAGEWCVVSLNLCFKYATTP